MKSLFPMLLLSISANSLGEIVIPIEVQNGNPIANAVIEGHDVRLVVDSGGSSLGLRPEIVAKLNLTRSAEKTSKTNILGEVRTSDTIEIPSLEIGGASFSNVSAYEWQMPLQLRNWEPLIDGTLGRDFLNEFVAVYNYGNLTITLYENGAEEAQDCKGTAVALLDHPEQIVATKVVVDHGTVNALWDTGATHSFIKAQVADERGFPLVPDEGQTQFYKSERFSLGGSDFGPLDFVALPFTEPQSVDVYIGRNFFAEHVVCVNTFQKSIRIRANR